jgi:arginine decarboxylase
MTAIDLLKQQGMIDSVKLLHFHIGSQITKIDKIKTALIEGTRVYAEMKKLGVKLEYVDIGGGLGVDYDGSKSSYFSSVNYTVEEYANDVVYQIKNICDEAGVECPNIISESGRAIGRPLFGAGHQHPQHQHPDLAPDFEEVLRPPRSSPPR